AIMGRFRPAALELMDRTALDAVEAHTHMGLDPAWGALLLARSDAGPAAESEIATMVSMCEGAGANYVAATDDEAEGEQFMAARRVVLIAVERLGTILIEDVGVPIPRIPDLLEHIDAVAARNRTTVVVVGHAGDGNFHPVVAFDRDDPDAVARAQV